MVAHHSVEEHAQSHPPGLNELCGHLVFLDNVLLWKGGYYDSCIDTFLYQRPKAPQ